MIVRDFCFRNEKFYKLIPNVTDLLIFFNSYFLISAAHCTWKTDPENLLLAFGKFYREISIHEPNAQLIRAKKIEILESYQDASGNYNGDLSVVFLKKSVELNKFVRPVCVDWDQKYMDKQLEEGSLGTVIDYFTQFDLILYLQIVGRKSLFPRSPRPQFFQYFFFL